MVNKFIPINYSDKNVSYLNVYLQKVKYKSYKKGCQKELRQLKEDYYDKYRDITVKKDTVIYGARPVMATNNQTDWTYEVKTTGSSLGGDFTMVEDMISSILRIMRTGRP